MTSNLHILQAVGRERTADLLRAAAAYKRPHRPIRPARTASWPSSRSRV